MTAEGNLRQLQLQLMPVRNTYIQKRQEHAGKRQHIDRSAEKGKEGRFQYGMVHKPVSIQEALKIPEAKAAVDK